MRYWARSPSAKHFARLCRSVQCIYIYLFIYLKNKYYTKEWASLQAATIRGGAIHALTLTRRSKGARSLQLYCINNMRNTTSNRSAKIMTLKEVVRATIQTGTLTAVLALHVPYYVILNISRRFGPVEVLVRNPMTPTWRLRMHLAAWRTTRLPPLMLSFISPGMRHAIVCETEKSSPP